MPRQDNRGAPRRWLRAVVLVVYVALGTAGLGVASPALRTWALVVIRPAVFVPRLPPLWPWLLPALAIVVGLQHMVASTLARARLKRPLAALVLVGTGVCLANVRLLPSPAVVPASLPRDRLGVALSQVTRRLEASHAKLGSYPSVFPGDGRHLLEGAAPVSTGYLGHGRRIRFQVVSREPAPGPALRARAADGPGTIYYVRSLDGRRYWLTALLMARQPVGAARFVRTAQGHAWIIAGGQAAPTGG